MRLHWAALLGAVLLLAGCSGTSEPTAAPSPPVVPTTPAAPTSAAPIVIGDCQVPPKDLIDWAGYAIASHPGPFTATAMVRAATTATGVWYVIAVERAYVHDDGSLAGGASLSAALTNDATAVTDHEDPQMIPLGADDVPETGAGRDSFRADWSNVSWTGATLNAGRAALQRALTCLA